MPTSSTHWVTRATYYPPGAERISDDRLFGMYHSKTDDHNKDVIMKSMNQLDGVTSGCGEEVFREQC